MLSVISKQLTLLKSEKYSDLIFTLNFDRQVKINFLKTASQGFLT